MTLIRVEGICSSSPPSRPKLEPALRPGHCEMRRHLFGSSYPTDGRRHIPIPTMICARSRRNHRVSPFPLPVKSLCSKQPTSQRALLIQVVWHPCCSSRRCLIVELSYVPSGPVCVSHNPSGLSSFFREQIVCGFFFLLIALIAVLFPFFKFQSEIEDLILFFWSQACFLETELAQPAVWKAPYGPLIT